MPVRLARADVLSSVDTWSLPPLWNKASGADNEEEMIMINMVQAVTPVLLASGFVFEDGRFIRDGKDEVEFEATEEGDWMAVIADGTLVAECKAINLRACLVVLWAYGLVDWLHIREQM